MKHNMKQWRADVLASDDARSMPIMTYPGLGLAKKRISEMVNDAETQFQAIQQIDAPGTTVLCLNIFGRIEMCSRTMSGCASTLSCQLRRL